LIRKIILTADKEDDKIEFTQDFPDFSHTQ